MATKQQSHNFDGRTVVTFESRMADSMIRMIENQGGKPVSAPSMQEIPLEKNPEAFQFAERLLKGDIDVILFMTGVGARYLLQVLETQYTKEQIVDAWKKTMVVARGPKAVKALTDLNVPVTLVVPEPNTWREVLEELDQNEKGVSLEGKVVAVQEYGIPNDSLIEELKRRGACVVQVPVYRWALPDDLTSLNYAVDQILDKKVPVVLFTNAAQIQHVFKVASERGVGEDLRTAFNDVVIGSVGPTCSEALIANGLRADVEPVHPKMGPLITETARRVADIIKERENPSIKVNSSRERCDAVSHEALSNSIFMRACRKESVERTPIWLMRQAGRYMKEYMEVRNKVTFLELCKSPELVTEVTVTAQQKLNVDAAIIFADILLIIEPLGLELRFDTGHGPVIEGALESEKDISQLLEVNPEESLSYVFDAIKMTRSALPADIPLLGFSAAPFTLASYMIEGGGSRNFEKTKTLMYSNPQAWHLLMEKVSGALARYLILQVKAGAQALQVFDSWVGALGVEDYLKYVFPYSKKLIDAVKKELPKCPLIHFGTGNPLLLKHMSEAGGDVMGVDFRMDIDTAWKDVGREKALMGNLDPLVLYSSKDVIKERAHHILNQVQSRPGFIFNLGHGILPKTPVENAQYLVDVVHEWKV